MSTEPLTQPGVSDTCTVRSAAPTVWLGLISEVTIAFGKSLSSSSGVSRLFSVMMSPCFRWLSTMPRIMVSL